MLSVVGTAKSGSDGANIKSNTDNPFERLQPPLRSEEDEIRKGIFGQTLRLLHTATDEDKLRWRHAIEEAIAARQSISRMNKKTAVAEGVADATSLAGVAAVKRPRDDGKGEVEEGEAKEEKETGTMEKEGDGDRDQRPVDAAVKDSCGCRTGVEDASMKDTEFIAAYLRTLLDKVVGLSLLELHVDALRVLCVILSIPLPKSRSKMTLYSTLASFHYTHCEKLGKRVSSSHNVQAQLKRDEQMIKKIFSPGSTSQTISGLGRNRATGAKNTTTTTTASRPSSITKTVNSITLSNHSNSSCTDKHVSNGSAKHKKSTRAMLTAVDNNVSPLDDTTRSRRRKSVSNTGAKPKNKSPLEEDAKDTPAGVEGESELEVRHTGKVFADAPVFRQAIAVSRNNGEEEEEEEEEEEWTMAQLEKKVASVVQLYDPVTSAVVVKKLAQMGYRKACAMENVEAILRGFHQRELVFYDNGIAYLL
ncbi:hypothetical protein MOQ_003634 [Trypanosoma cruzi marinkellei]|uniref:Uncharacterized protein n=1 Tax=Trypanosoma cruzi marinkellei TaxID=85056 RepID=K2MBI2_TRYCR|nr:hypothetical protein MOQ_003634 [Trypanosoma cruzi marinkellei]